MKITTQYLNNYRAQLNELENAAGEYMQEYLKLYQATYPDAPVAEMREVAKAAIEDSLSFFGVQAGEISCELFDKVCAAEDINAKAEVFDVIDREKMDAKVRFFAKKLVEGDSEAFTKSVSDLTKFYIKRSAYENMTSNCYKNNVMYARVPSGFETCKFCMMLASRGFAYHTEKSAEGRHGIHFKCDCVVIPGVEGQTKIAGYDPDEYYQKYKESGLREEFRNKREKDRLEGKQSSKRANRSEYSFVGKDGQPSFENFNDVKAYLYGAKTQEELEHRYSVLGNAFGFKSSQMQSQSLKNVMKTVSKGIKGDEFKFDKLTFMKHEEPLVKLPKTKTGFSVSSKVNTKEYHDAFIKMPIAKPVAESAYIQVGRILEKANNTQNEYLVAINARTGDLITDNLDMKPKGDGKTGITLKQQQMIDGCKDGVILIHNHPNSIRPSYTDVYTATTESSVKGGIVAAHDSDLWFYSAPSPDVEELLDNLYNDAKEVYNDKDKAKSVALSALLRQNGNNKLFKWEKVR